MLCETFDLNSTPGREMQWAFSCTPGVLHVRVHMCAHRCVGPSPEAQRPGGQGLSRISISGSTEGAAGSASTWAGQHFQLYLWEPRIF